MCAKGQAGRDTSGNRTRSSPGFSSRFGAPLVLREERRQCKKNKGFPLLSLFLSLDYKMPSLPSLVASRASSYRDLLTFCPHRVPFSTRKSPRSHPLSLSLRSHLLDLRSPRIIKRKTPTKSVFDQTVAERGGGARRR